MANRWEKMETVVDFIFLASKMTVDSDCNQKIKRCLLLRRKDMPNLDSVLKIRDITLLTKICTVKSMGFFSVVMYGCESSTKKKAEHWRTGDFELWWRRLLRVPWIARRSNQPIPVEINPEYSLEGLMLKLKLQYFDKLMQRANSLEKTLMLENTVGRRRTEWQRMKLLDAIIDWMDMSLSKFWEIVKDRETWHAAVQGVTKTQTRLSNSATTPRSMLIIINNTILCA